MKYCKNCGLQLNDEDKFCTKCGNSVDLYEKTETVQTVQTAENTETSTENQSPPKINSGQFVVQPQVVVLKKVKLNPLVVIIPIVSVVLAVAIVVALFTVFGKSVVKTSNDGEKVFNFSPKEYIQLYNDANADVLTEEMEFSSFEYDTNKNGNDLYLLSYRDAAYVLFTDGKGYASNVNSIKYYWNYSYDGNPPAGIVRELRGVYPDLSYDAAESILKEAKNKEFMGYDYRDVTITYEYDKDSNAQSWFINPKD